MTITSIHNPLIKQCLALKEAKHRQELGLTLIDGKREVERALAAGAEITHILRCPDWLAETWTTKSKAQVIDMPPNLFSKICFGQRQEGLMAIAKVSVKKVRDVRLPKNPLVVIVESVEKPGNLGAIVRTCDGAGVDAVFIADPKTDVYNPHAIRSSVATLFSIPIACGDQEEIQAMLKAHQIKTVAAVVQAKTIYTQASLQGAVAILLGKEDQGLSPFWLKHCDQTVAIPMKGQADSLNVSVSAAILIYEALRQRT